MGNRSLIEKVEIVESSSVGSIKMDLGMFRSVALNSLSTRKGGLNICSSLIH